MRRTAIESLSPACYRLHLSPLSFPRRRCGKKQVRNRRPTCDALLDNMSISMTAISDPEPAGVIRFRRVFASR